MRARWIMETRSISLRENVQPPRESRENPSFNREAGRSQMALLSVCRLFHGWLASSQPCPANGDYVALMATSIQWATKGERAGFLRWKIIRRHFIRYRRYRSVNAPEWRIALPTRLAATVTTEWSAFVKSCIVAYHVLYRGSKYLLRAG